MKDSCDHPFNYLFLKKSAVKGRVYVACHKCNDIVGTCIWEHDVL